MTTWLRLVIVHARDTHEYVKKKIKKNKKMIVGTGMGYQGRGIYILIRRGFTWRF